MSSETSDQPRAPAHVQKIYTKTGDFGTTTLLGSQKRVVKWDRRVKAYGAVDELNAHLGQVREVLGDLPRYSAASNRMLNGDLFEDMTTIQRTLFIMSSWLSRATYGEADTSGLQEVKGDYVASLETRIDQMTAVLPPLKNFILLSGDGTTVIHVARTVCRRAEAATCKAVYEQMAESADQYAIIMAYINRLSDWLFTVARYYAKEADQKEVCV